MKEIQIRDEFIRLGQALKLAGLVSSGVEAKILIKEGNAKVNGAVCTERGKKLRDGDQFSFGNEEYRVKAPAAP